MKVGLDNPAPGHKVTVSRKNLGQGRLGGGSFYGTVAHCECGWEWETNEAASKGGKAAARDAYRTHVAAMDTPEGRGAMLRTLQAEAARYGERWVESNLRGRPDVTRGVLASRRYARVYRFMADYMGVGS
jgi:hypothetical protein